jgi:hypothetical protein
MPCTCQPAYRYRRVDPSPDVDTNTDLTSVSDSHSNSHSSRCGCGAMLRMVLPWSHFAVDESPLAGSQESLGVQRPAKFCHWWTSPQSAGDARPVEEGHARFGTSLACSRLLGASRPSKNKVVLECMSHSSHQLHHHWSAVGHGARLMEA